ncbi:nocobactin polyketide synthase NbtC [Nocardia sp. NPDC050710]|uniref:nocobactin polyketide synthase NbtC n=1 Tax=Nocardia sp. NPDC050710 TaxID=3157220 RepID=UPI0033F04C32
MPDYRLPDGTIPVLLSSETADGMRAEAAALRSYLEKYPQVTPDAVADMLFRTRIARKRRSLAMVSTREELLAALDAVVADTAHPAVVSTVGAATARRIGFVFPGQGSQRPGMGTLYYELSPEYRAEVDACAAIHLERYGHEQPLHYLLGTAGKYEEAVWEVQPALMFHMTGLAAMWRAAGVRPVATVGHSQGELAAGAVSAVMTRRDAVLAVTHRARLVERIAPRGYSMAVLGMDREECEQLLARHSGWAELSVVNAPHILAISGDRETIVEMVAIAGERGRFAKEIQVAYPAHTSIVAELREEFVRLLGDEMSSPTFHQSEIACYGATLGTEITPDLTHEHYWYWNLRNRVRFDRAIVAAAAEVDTFIEISEHPMLQLAVQENLTLVPPDPVRGPRDFQVIGTSLRTATGLREFTRNLAAVAVSDLNYPWESLRIDSGARPRLPLPDFPHTVTNPKRLWAAYRPAVSIVPAPAAVEPVRLVEEWARLSRRTLIAPRTVLAVGSSDDRCAELRAALELRAGRHGATVFGSGVVDLDSTATPDTVLVLVPPSAAVDQAAAVAEFADFAADTSWRSALGAGITECWLVTTGAEAARQQDIPAPAQAAVAAAFRSIALEHIGVAFRHLDLPPDAVAQPPNVLADRILDAIHLAQEPELAVREGALYAKRLVVDHQSTAAAVVPREALIVGGTGHVGSAFCAELVRAGAARVTLVSRRGETEAFGPRLRELRALGTTEIDVVACDITDETAVAALADRYGAGAVDVVVHAAVDYVYSTETEASDAVTASASKVLGLERVLRLVPQTPDCRVLLCSSFAATLGGVGQAMYAGANRMLDSIAQRLRAEDRHCTSVQWGLWVLPAQADAAVRTRIEGSGLLPMAEPAAVAAGLADLPANSIVLSADWTRLRGIAEAVGLAPVFDPALAELERTAEPPTPAESAAPAPIVTSTTDEGTLAEQMRRELDRVICGDGPEAIDGSVPLVALGLDSLQTLDLRKRIQAELNRDLPVAAIMGGASLDDVVLLMSENENKG